MSTEHTQNIAPEDMLCSYVNGHADPAECFFIEANRKTNKVVQGTIAFMEEVSSSLAETGAPADIGFTAESIMDNEAFQDLDNTPINKDNEIHPFITSVLEGTDNNLKWRKLGKDFAYINIPVDNSEYDLKLMRLAKGAGVPEHSHDGDEVTLVLTGAFKDGETVYKAGDVAFHEGDDGHDHDHHHTHAPKAIEECVCLVLTKGSLRFKSVWGRLANLFVR